MIGPKKEPVAPLGDIIGSRRPLPARAETAQQRLKRLIRSGAERLMNGANGSVAEAASLGEIIGGAKV